MKADLAGATMEAGGKIASMSHNELKQLFGLDVGTECSTKQLLESCSAGESVVWLSLNNSSGRSSGGGLPSVLAAAVAAESVTAINREKLPGEVGSAASKVATTAATAPASPGTAGRRGAQQSSDRGLGSIDDVEELEVEDDD